MLFCICVCEQLVAKECDSQNQALSYSSSKPNGIEGSWEGLAEFAVFSKSKGFSSVCTFHLGRSWVWYINFEMEK